MSDTDTTDTSASRNISDLPQLPASSRPITRPASPIADANPTVPTEANATCTSVDSMDVSPFGASSFKASSFGASTFRCFNPVIPISSGLGRDVNPPGSATVGSGDSAPSRRSRRLIFRRHSALDTQAHRTPKGPSVSSSKRPCDLEQVESGSSSKVRVVEPQQKIEFLTTQIAEQTDKIRGLENTILSCRENEAEATNVKRQLEAQIKVLEKEQNDVQNAYAESLKTIEKLKRSHQAETEAIQANVIAEASAKNSLDSLTKEHNALRSAYELKLSEAQDSLTAKDAEIKEYQSTSARLLEKQSVLELELKNAQSSHKNATTLRKESIAQLDLQIEEQQKLKDTLREAKENLETVLRSLFVTENQLTSSQQAEKQYKSKIEELNQVIASTRADYAHLTSSKATLQENLERTSRLLEQKTIALETQEGFKEKFDESRRELAVSNTKNVELSEKINNLQQSARAIRGEYSSQVDTLKERLADTQELVDKATRQLQDQRRELLNDKNEALELERKEREVQAKLLKETQTRVNEVRQENNLLKDRISVLEIENKRLGKRRADHPADEEEEEVSNLLDLNERRNTRRRTETGQRSPSIYSVLSIRNQEPQHHPVIVETPASEENVPVPNPSPGPSNQLPVLSPLPVPSTTLSSPFREIRPRRMVSPEIADPGTYHLLGQGQHTPSRSDREGPSQHYNSGDRTRPSPGPSRDQHQPSAPEWLGGPSSRGPRDSPERTRQASLVTPNERPQYRREGEASSNLYGSIPTTPQNLNDRMEDNSSPFTPSQIQEFARALNKYARASKKPQDRVSPFKSEASTRPRTQERNYVMSETRALLFKLLELKNDADVINLKLSHLAEPEEIRAFAQGEMTSIFLEPLKVNLDEVKCEWNVNLGRLFANRLIRANPRLRGYDEQIVEHFLNRLTTLKAAFAKRLPRQGETEAEAETRASLAHKKSLHEKRIRTRQIELKERRIEDCAAGNTTEDEELAEMVEILGNDGVSSDESDGHGNQLVREKFWRNRAITNRMARADEKHETTGVYGNRKPGATLQRRIRRQHGPISTKKIPARKPINYYDAAMYHSLSLHERVQLDAQPRVPFRGEYDPVDESLFD